MRQPQSNNSELLMIKSDHNNDMMMMDSSSTTIITEPKSADILCGKNKVCMDHPGSKAFRLVIERNARRYREADSKYEKMNITKEIYEEMTQESRRFLKYDSQSRGWQELNSSQVRDKVGHSLRFRNKRKSINSSSVSSKAKSCMRRRSVSSESGSSSSEESVVIEQLPPPPLVQNLSTSTATSNDYSRINIVPYSSMPPPVELLPANTDVVDPDLPEAPLTPNLLDDSNSHPKNHQDQIPSTKIKPTKLNSINYSIQHTNDTALPPPPPSMLLKSVSGAKDGLLYPTTTSLEQQENNVRAPLLKDDCDLFLIMQEPLMEFDPLAVKKV